MNIFEEHIYKTTLITTIANFEMVVTSSTAQLQFGTDNSFIGVKFKILINDQYEGVLETTTSNFITFNLSSLISTSLYNTLLDIKISPINGRSDLSEIVSLNVPVSSGNSCYFNTDIANFLKFPKLRSLGTGGSINSNGNIYGDLIDMPRNLVTFQYQGELTGNGENLPNTLKVFNIRRSFAGYNPTFTIDINTLPNSLENLTLAHLNIDISGNFTDFGTNIRRVDLTQIQGSEGSLIIDLDNLPISLQYINIATNSGTAVKVIGNISGLHEGMTTLSIKTPVSLDSYLTGNISNFPSTLQNISISNVPNDITGDWATLPESLYYIFIDGDNTIYGDIGTTKDALMHIYLEGLNELTGLVQECLTKLRSVLDIKGLNTISGDFGLCYMIPTVRLYGENIVSNFTYPNSVTFPSSSFQFRLEGNCNLSTTEVDNFLIMLDDNYTHNSLSKTVVITGNSSPRSSASDIAYNSLISKNFSINLNN